VYDDEADDYSDSVQMERRMDSGFQIRLENVKKLVDWKN